MRGKMKERGGRGMKVRGRGRNTGKEMRVR